MGLCVGGGKEGEGGWGKGLVGGCCTELMGQGEVGPSSES